MIVDCQHVIADQRSIPNPAFPFSRVHNRRHHRVRGVHSRQVLVSGMVLLRKHSVRRGGHLGLCRSNTCNSDKKAERILCQPTSAFLS